MISFSFFFQFYFFRRSTKQNGKWNVGMSGEQMYGQKAKNKKHEKVDNENVFWMKKISFFFLWHFTLFRLGWSNVINIWKLLVAFVTLNVLRMRWVVKFYCRIVWMSGGWQEFVEFHKFFMKRSAEGCNAL